MILVITGKPTATYETVKQIRVSFEVDDYREKTYFLDTPRVAPLILTCKLTLLLKYNKEITYKVMVKTTNNSTTIEELRLLALHRLFTNHHKELGSLRSEVMSELIMKGKL